MKTLSVEIERRQTLTFFVSVPDHWPRNLTQTALTSPVIEKITEKSDAFDWDNGDADLRIAALYELVDEDEDIDYAFPDEPAPPHPDQLALTTLETPA